MNSRQAASCTSQCHVYLIGSKLQVLLPLERPEVNLNIIA